MSQLELFRTSEQNERLENAVKAFDRRQVEAMQEYTRALRILKANHFIEGVHYKLEGEGDFVVDYQDFDYGRWNENGLIEEISVDKWSGNIKFLWSEYSEITGKVEKRASNFTFNDGKFNVWGLQQNNRYIKAETLRGKLSDSHQIAQRRYDTVREEEARIEKAMEELQTKFPDAKVNKDWDNRIKIEFENGNYVSYSVMSNGELWERRVNIVTLNQLKDDDKLKMLQSL